MRRSVVKTDEMMYVPILGTIQNLLKRDTIIAEVNIPICFFMLVHIVTCYFFDRLRKDT